ncbi:glycosyltransferase family 2 protein [Vibrio parahaemolyticus]|uniref:Teichoic acid poly(Glycerol phosphate) polymerase n=3 Tax=Vibrio parahaemolyticus TaxID=670 RepID=A0A7M1W9H8_VIBPH|nr:glycosyltransferase family 2 protein [Vibrio parahaemolyticus]EGQ8166976.1 glycosyltransferase family 2 protein [Vibrio parahaemolyticus]EGR3438309.1 glycosyltransferase family 2 protein [Vibrio parahaemolyticus]MBA5879153.1 glycosyltransferase family 2 protein [Vibrio parahaemolyticus]MBA5883916.1 glycosyltransferase family 2 protein [Vibrio parahaemolyticus]MBA5887194.1 glycosyltransferase family 2 protein [Vibrio parahaemolyticus]
MKLENVSVIITNYNKGDLLVRAIDSVLKQLDKGDEVIIVDDASTGEQDKINLKELKDNKLLKIHKNDENKGVCYSKNLGVDMAMNDIIVLLDADDTLPNKAIITIKNEFYTRELDVLYGDYTYGNADERVVVSCESISSDNVIDINKLSKNWLLLGSSPFRKSKCFSLIRFNQNFNRTDDVDFHRQLLIKGLKFGYVNQVIYDWEIFPGGNNDGIPNEDIFYSHCLGMKFFVNNLNGLDYVKFIIKFLIRLSMVSVKKICLRF